MAVTYKFEHHLRLMKLYFGGLATSLLAFLPINNALTFLRLEARLLQLQARLIELITTCITPLQRDRKRSDILVRNGYDTFRVPFALPSGR